MNHRIDLCIIIFYNPFLPQQPVDRPDGRLERGPEEPEGSGPLLRFNILAVADGSFLDRGNVPQAVLQCDPLRGSESVASQLC